MSKTNVFALFGILFLSSVLLGNGMYSGQVFALENQTGTENEAEVEADIEQENKCKKDTECKNENELNNQLSITTTTGQQQEEPETPTCETCFTNTLSEEELNNYLETFAIASQGLITTLEELCEYITTAEGTESLNADLALVASESNLPTETYQALIECLQQAGFDVENLQAD